MLDSSNINIQTLGFQQKSYIATKGLQIIKPVAIKLQPNIASNNTIKENLVNYLVKSQLDSPTKTLIDN